MWFMTLHAAVVGAGSILVAGGELGATGGDMPILTPPSTARHLAELQS